MTIDHISFVDICRQRAQEQGDQTAFIFLSARDAEPTEISYGELDLRARKLAAYLQQELEPGSRVLLLFPPGLDFIAAFLGCLYAGMPAVPLYPPRPNQRRHQLDGTLENCAPSMALTNEVTHDLCAELFGERVAVRQFAETQSGSADAWKGSHNAEDVAFLQYTSGSTGDPKGVMVTHGSLTANQKAIGQAFQTTSKDVCVSWLPVYHDMGLIGTVLHPLYQGFPSVLMPSMAFIRDPLFWLETIARYEATLSGGPNFAYDLVASKATNIPESLSLASWRVAFNGAEPVRAATLRSFSDACSPFGFRHEAHFPCYGMAEATLFVSGDSPELAPGGLWVDEDALSRNEIHEAEENEGLNVVDCGTPAPEHKVLVVDPSTGAALPERKVGQVWYAGSSVASGYWNNTSLTDETFNARVEGDSETSFLRTGDLGFLHKGRLFVTGRLKDLIIIRGRNYYPQDIEQAVIGASIQANGVAAFAVTTEGNEQLVVVAEVKRTAMKGGDLAQIAAEIRATVADSFTLQVHRVVLIKQGGVPKTTSGKIRRRACAQALASDTLPVLEESSIEAPSIDQPSLSLDELAVEDAPRERLTTYLRGLVTKATGQTEIAEDENLIRYGMDSLAAMTIVNGLTEDLGISLQPEVLLQGATITQLADAVFLEIDESKASNADDLAEGPENRLAFNERALWFIQKMSPETSAYHLPFAVRLGADLDLDRFRNALERLIDRHPVLRTRYVEIDGDPFRRVGADSSEVLKSVDAREWSEAQVDEFLEAESIRPFDLEKSPPLRATLLTTDSGTIFHLNIHHIAADFWSLQVMLEGLGEFYANPESLLAPEKVPFKTHVTAQHELTASAKGDRLWTYWHKKLADAPNLLELPTDFSRPASQCFDGQRAHFTLSGTALSRLNRIAKEKGTTKFTVMAALYQSLLRRYSGQSEILVGTPFANRGNLSDTVGFLSDPIVLRADFREKCSFSELLEATKTDVAESMAHAAFPFQLLVERLQPDRKVGHSPVFQASLTYQQAHITPGASALAMGLPGSKLNLGALEMEVVPLDVCASQFDLALYITEVDGELRAYFEYATALFKPETMATMARHFQNLFNAALENPELPVDRLDMLGEDASQLIALGNGDRVEAPATCIHHHFLRHVQETPYREALTFPGEDGESPIRLTYAEVHERAQLLAGLLQARGVKPESLVGLYLERSPDLVIAALAVLLAGGAYVPMDVNHPKDRVAYIINDTEMSLVLSDGGGASKLPEDMDVLLVDERPKNPVPLAEVTVYPENLAYIIYTSGSTGKPKGVQVTHAQVDRLFHTTQADFQFNSDDVWTLFHAYIFDFSVWECWGPLTTGGRLVVVPHWLTKTPRRFLDLLIEESVTVLNQTPSAFRQLTQALEDLPKSAETALRTIIFGGEALDPTSLQSWFQRFGEKAPAMINMYGITETTVHVTYRRVTPEDAEIPGVSPIGRQIPDLDLYVLNDELSFNGPGVAAEMFIGGPGVARGYLNRPSLTATRFVPDPFANEPGARLYRSGDLALPGEDLVYKGRIDHQVKISGYRIELGEIEAVLAEHQDVAECLVITQKPTINPKRDDPRTAHSVVRSETLSELRGFLHEHPEEREQEESERLVAYVICPEQFNISALRSHLEERLPAYMAPSAFVRIEKFPLTVNGKLDRAALPKPGKDRPDLAIPYTKPRSLSEKNLADIWSQILGIDRIGIHDNFFDLGGDSLRSIKVRALAAERGLSFSIQQIFQNPTIAELAEVISGETVQETGGPLTQPFELVSEKDRAKLPSNLVDAYPLGQTQAGVIFHMQKNTDSPIYHDIFLYHFKSPFDETLLRRALNQVVARHAMLRSEFDLINFSEPLQLVHPSADPVLIVEDLRTMDDKAQSEHVNSWLQGEKYQGFDLAKPPLVRFFVFRLTDETFQLVVSFHNATMDGWSMASLVSELLHRFRRFLAGEEPSIDPPMQAFYRDFIGLERKTISNPESKRFWSEFLDEAEVNPVPSWELQPDTSGIIQLGVLNVPISPSTSRGLKRLAELASVPIKDVLLAAHMRVMRILKGTNDVLTGLESNGRVEEADGEKVLGLHLQSLPFRLKMDGGTWIDLCRQTFDADRALMPHRRYPLAELQLERGRQNLVDVVFNYIHFHIFKTIEDMEVIDGRGFGESHFPLRAELNQNPFTHHIALDLECNMVQIGEEQLRAIGSYYDKTFRAMAEDPHGRYDRIEVLSDWEVERLLGTWNNTAKELEGENLVGVFRDICRSNAQATAVVAQDGTLTYEALEREAVRLAAYLRDKGVGVETPVGLILNRGVNIPVAVWAVLMAGGAYVPIDPNISEERLEFITFDAGIDLVLSTAEILERFPTLPMETVALDQLTLDEPENTTFAPIHREQLAYIIYTSGTTQKPKGVQISHGSLFNSNQSRYAYYPDAVGAFMWVSPYTFDSSLVGFYQTLCSGGALIIPPDGGHRDIIPLAQSIRDNGVTHWLSVPSLFQTLLDLAPQEDLQSLRSVILAGEALPEELTSRIRKTLPKVRIYNEYGPTEAAVWSSCYDVTDHPDGAPMLIGKPIANTYSRIMDAYFHHAVVGTKGELCIGGLGLARGYVKAPARTAAMFVPDPYSTEPGARIYRGGDLARFLKTGDLQIFGRMDHQIKINGFRIEPGEIEAALADTEGVAQSLVVARDEPKRLVGYVTPEQGVALDEEALLSRLGEVLPAYMVPAAVVVLDEFPLSPHGKVDRRKLPSPEEINEQRMMERLLTNLENMPDEEAKLLLQQVGAL